MTDKYHVYRPVLDLLGNSEGTDKGDGYNETLAYGAYTDGDVDLVSMTLRQIDALQTKMLKHPKNKWNSSAIGRYQIVRTTMREIRKTLGLDPQALFDEDMQDRMACYLLGLRGIDKWLAGRLSTDTLLENLAAEWASLPMPNGKGRYSGQNASVSVPEVKHALSEVRARHMSDQPVKVETVKVEKPVIPDKVEKEVRQKTNWGAWITSILGGLGGLGTWLTSADSQLIIGLLIAGFIASGIILFAGEWIIRRLKRMARLLEEA